MWQTQYSEIDDSVNFIKSKGKSFIECRYVRRQDNQVVVYLSSHNGCNQSCRFCHLTATGQTEMEPVSIDQFTAQVQKVLHYWYTRQRNGQERIVNFNFMARGEPLLNSTLLGEFGYLRHIMKITADHHKLDSVFNISTIIPKDFDSFESMFRLSGDNRMPPDVRIYWSLYSPNEKFRKRWIPKSMNPYEAAQRINNFREFGGKVVLHNAFIKGQNDTPEQIDELVEFIRFNGLQDLDYNLVAYNPYSVRHGEESDRMLEIFEKLSEVMSGRVQIIERVGKDVKASCGMFIEQNQ